MIFLQARVPVPRWPGSGKAGEIGVAHSLSGTFTTVCSAGSGGFICGLAGLLNVSGGDAGDGAWTEVLRRSFLVQPPFPPVRR